MALVPSFVAVGTTGLKFADADLTSEEHRQASYLQYDLWVGALTEQGVIQVPTDSGAVVCTLHAAYATKFVRFFAVRRFKMPTLPDPRPQSSNETLARTWVCPRGPSVWMDGT